jgi:polar amino acid transport system substrate-binding protein
MLSTAESKRGCRSITKFLWLLGATLVLLCGSPACDAQETTEPERSQLIVGTKVSPPFAIKLEDGSWSGISIELWRRIAADMDMDYEFREVDLQDVFEQLEAGEIDVAIAAISITAERDRHVDFSHAYYSTGLGIAVPQRRTLSLWGLLRGLLTARFFEIICGLLVIGIVTGVLLWRLERRRNEGMFGGRTREGVSMGIWWSTIMLLGHKGVVPATGWARILSGIVMIVSTVIVSALTGVFASAITISQLEPGIAHPNDLRHIRTATVTSSTSAEYLTSRRIQHKPYSTIDAALQAMLANQADAVVYDLSMLKYRRNTELLNRINVLPQVFNRQQYAIALAPHSGLRRPVNQALLLITSSDAWSDVLFRYIGE